MRRPLRMMLAASSSIGAFEQADGQDRRIGHPAPLVRSATNATASGMDVTKWVAPNSIAMARFSAIGSMTMIFSAPASRCPWTAPLPMPPRPITTTVSPGDTSAVFTGRAPAGGDPAAQQAGPRQRKIVVDLRSTPPGTVPYCERCRRTPSRRRSAPRAAPVGPVGLGAGHDQSTQIARVPQ